MSVTNPAADCPLEHDRDHDLEREPNKLDAYEPPASISRLTLGSSPWIGATVAEVDAGSPAYREGIRPGMVITHVNDIELRDAITWDWEADDRDVHLEGIAHPGAPDEFAFECDLSRDFGQDWGITFDGAIFDGIRTCRNNCVFCFMKMLPKGMRPSLYIRDDDYRLSFLQGNFVTLTNMEESDVQRVIDERLSPLNVSLHAVTPRVRESLIGRNERRGIEVLERLMSAGIEIHAQIVLVPGMNDGQELERTLAYVERHDRITSLGIVPLGYTRFQTAFSSSYSSDPHAAAEVVDLVRRFQERSRARCGKTRFHLSDEFYLITHKDPPPAEAYDGFPQYYDGIGMVRTFLDELRSAEGDEPLKERIDDAVDALARRSHKVLLVVGKAAEPLAARAIDGLGMAGAVRAHPVRNDYFGGNVDVSGLLTAQDILAQLPLRLVATTVVLPDVMFNADSLTLDGLTQARLASALRERGAACRVIEPTPLGIAECVIDEAAQNSR